MDAIEEAINDTEAAPVEVEEAENVPSGYMPGPAQIIDCGDGILMPAMFYYCVEDADLYAIARFWGYALRIVTLEMDESAEELLVAHNAGKAVLELWNPPQVPGWHMVGRLPTSDVPVALYVTELEGEGESEDEEACKPVPA